MNVIELARELGKALQADERYIAYHEAKLANDNDEELQALIGEFNMKRMQLNALMSKTERDTDKINEMNNELRLLYGKVMGNEKMVAYNNAKADVDDLLDQVNNIITASANGEDPATCPAVVHKCSGSCSTCGGCH